MKHKVAIQFPIYLLEMMDVARSQHPDKPSRAHLVLELVSEGLGAPKIVNKPAPVRNRPVPNSNAKSSTFKPIEISKLERGEWLSRLPYGYADVKEAEILLSIFQDYATGNYSIDALFKKAQGIEGFALSRGTLWNLFKNKFYIGIMTWRGKEFPHHYPKLIPQHIFDRVQLVRAGNKYGSLFPSKDLHETPPTSIAQTITIKATDSFLQHFKSPITFDDLRIKTGLNVEELGSKIFDYEFRELIEEVGPSRWAIKS